MKKFSFNVIAFVALVTLFAACNSGKNEDLLFKGEGENWESEVYTGKVIEPEVKENEPYLYVKFKGEDPGSVKITEYKLESSEGSWGGGGKILDKQGQFIPKFEEEHALVTSETDEMTLSIKWLEEEEQNKEVMIIEKK
ncbi:hypothetical protein [Domibacillus tundrae]|uniref:hypothetical protein n=1 Tax=Domibacillus tundrae TaxID=1587527 RepID=UPI00339370FC